MAIYQKIGNKYTRKYGKSIIELSKDLKVSAATLSKWESCGFDLFEKAKVLNTFRSSGKKLTHLWNNLKFRCGNPKDKKYKYYGGKGIKLKLEKKDLAYLWERDMAYLLKQPSIDRLDSNDHYKLDNCRFIEMSENIKNGWLHRKQNSLTKQKKVVV